MSPSITRLSLALLSALLIGGVVYGVSQKRAESTAASSELPCDVFAADPHGMFLVRFQSKLEPVASPEDWAQGVFQKLQHGVSAPNFSAIPTDARLLEAEYRRPHWFLKIKLKENLGSNGERLMVGALVQTFLAGFPEAKDVKITLLNAQDKPLSGAHTDLSAPLTRSDVGNQLGNTSEAGPIKATLWWPAADTRDLIPVEVSLEGASGIPPRDSLQRLLRGPGSGGGQFLTALAVGPNDLHWNRLEKGTVFLDWHGGRPIPQTAAASIRAIGLTLTEFPEVRAVQILHNAVPLPEKVGQYDLAQPLRRKALTAPI
ncbi:MAG: GerMN domain-containing protein [Candidatus Sericytochromatia bacterium]|nr:GerMN domain-containing protein [Candidatus Sericytochromatia bacterium]